MRSSPSSPKVELPEAELLATDSLAAAPVLLEIGKSRDGRPILGYRAGHGPIGVSLIGGCHADEPVGPELLHRAVSYLAGIGADHPLNRTLTWSIVPHVNPDGAARNRMWTEDYVESNDHSGETARGYELRSYLSSVVRELPGDDIEFGFPEDPEAPHPGLRPENRSVARFLGEGPPIGLHGSFHGMGIAPGPWFLLEPSWIERTGELRRSLAARVADMGYRLFDIDRRGEKGFRRIEPGFSTRPDSGAMREFFEKRGEPGEAAKFRLSSMELARLLGPDTLTFVTEMPLFLTPSLAAAPSDLGELSALRAELARALAAPAPALEETARRLALSPMPIVDQMRLQLAFLNEALAAVVRECNRTRRT